MRAASPIKANVRCGASTTVPSTVESGPDRPSMSEHAAMRSIRSSEAACSTAGLVAHPI
jgi:hypothetical protein